MAKEGAPTMNQPVDESVGKAEKVVGAGAKIRTHPSDGPIADAEGDGAGTFGLEKASAKEIFEAARAKQEEDYIRLGKPD
jgi:hypothetical protein